MKNKQKNIYFIGIGGIGMSALAKYFISQSFNVAGYDLVKTEITNTLENLGVKIHYEDNPQLIPKKFKNPEQTTVIYTPAIPPEHQELNYFIENGFLVQKRSDVLAEISKNEKAIAIAGTHGKTSICAMISHILYEAKMLKYAFVGGITKNYNSNYIQGNNKNGFLVIEADEYDKTFLKFNPFIALITAIDIDHLDIYHDEKKLKDAFEQFINKVPENGIKILNSKVKLNTKKFFTYSSEEPADFFATEHFVFKGIQEFDIQTFKGTIKKVQLSLPGKVNIENAVAAASIATLLDIDPEIISDALYSFNGVKRRFDKLFDNGKKIFYTDYAHLPQEILALKQAIESFYVNRKILAIFQPHLYSRTKDLAKDFAAVLETFDNVILTEIYPAREKPIEGVSSDLIRNFMNRSDVPIIPLKQIPQYLDKYNFDIILTIGAGNIIDISHSIIDFLKHL